jgi:N-methylhydantoinase A
MWHRGQEFPIEVPLALDDLSEAWATQLRARFDARYRELYGRTDDKSPVEISALRVVGTRPGQVVAGLSAASEDDFPLPPRRQVYDSSSGRFVDIPVMRRGALAANTSVNGPIAIQDRETGVVLGRGERATRDASGAVLIELDGSAT